MRIRGEELARKIKEHDQIKATAKSEASRAKAQVEHLNAEFREISDEVNAGVAYRDVPCSWVAHDASKTMRLLREDTRAVVETRPMAPDELQVALFPGPSEIKPAKKGQG